jgi:hypothetical protein
MFHAWSVIDRRLYVNLSNYGIPALTPTNDNNSLKQAA